MKSIFEQGEFNYFKPIRLDEARAPITEYYQFSEYKPTVFISHKHDDLDDLKGVLGWLQQNYDVRVYIDSRDPSMPAITSGETAARIKGRIEKCKKVIFLATNAAIESKWCNWELGFGDAKKFEHGNIALFPMKPKDITYKGTEYFSIYPHIVYYNGSEQYIGGAPISAGYYVSTLNNGINSIVPLRNWLHN